MRAIRIEKHGGPETMKLVDIPVPEPETGQVRIKIEAVGLNNSDLMIREGRYVDEMPLPFIMGREFAGTIDKLGPGVEGWEVGQRVIAGNFWGGALADFAIALTGALTPLPDDFTPEQGAAFRVQCVSAMHIIDNCARVRPGETVLIHAAAGGVGGIAIQICQARGAKVIGTTSSDEKCERVAALGATAINYVKEDWVKKVLELTGGRGVDVVLESIGGEVLERSFKEALALYGRCVIYGRASGVPVQFHDFEILESNRALIGYYLSRHFPDHVHLIREAAEKSFAMIREGKLKLTIGHTYPLERAAEALQLIGDRKNIGKIVVTT
ncbi:MAG: NADPH:quinone oxidoreductase family protein [bacterium]|nr:NADPH:quinone oxidoreductase family protein [bacterium]